MSEIVLLLGSNLGDRKQHILCAIGQIHSRVGEVRAVSSLYSTEPWGFESTVYFLNAVVVADTTFSADKVLEKVLEIETLLGRQREGSVGYVSRTIDIDILFYSQQVIRKEGLEVPHPRLHLRRFTLEPLVEILPGFIHPVLNKSVKQLLEECSDENAVQKLEKPDLNEILRDSCN
ncbi:MAG: 2-amino-4-hydroxy-6-hydroxymethyldihydropteridine diphosphokinase [Bacteroidales bacterium]